MVHVRHATGLPDRVDIALDDVDDGGAVLGLDRAGDVEAVDVKRRLLQPIADLFALDQEELLVGAVQRVEPVDARQEVVIAQHQKSIAMLTVPAHHVVGRGVAVAVERVSMGVALVPVHGDRSLRWCRGLTGLQSPCGAAERQKKSKSGGTVHGPRFYRDPWTRRRNDGVAISASRSSPSSCPIPTATSRHRGVPGDACGLRTR